MQILAHKSGDGGLTWKPFLITILDWTRIANGGAITYPKRTGQWQFPIHFYDKIFFALFSFGIFFFFGALGVKAGWTFAETLWAFK